VAIETFELDTAKYTVRLNGKLAKISRLRFDVLQVLNEADGAPVPVRDIMQKVYGDRWVDLLEANVRVAVSTTNMISMSMTGEPLIGTLWNRGYFLHHVSRPLVALNDTRR